MVFTQKPGKKAAAFAAGRASASTLDAGRAPGADSGVPPAGGNWAKSAVNAMGDRLDEMRGMTLQGILEGGLPLRLRAEQIIDPLGTDRIAESEEGSDTDADTDGFQALLENIRRRGLRVPLRVRPEDPSWRPDPKSPHETGSASFILQSGRRRLKACRILGVDPLVFLSFVDAGDSRLDDLHERFFENTIRKQLSSFEKAWSIGLIAEETPGTQEQIAEIVGVSPAAVSRGLAVLRLREALEGMIPLASATAREIDGALAQIRKTHLSENPEAIRKREARARTSLNLPFSTLNFGDTRLTLRSMKGGRLALSTVSSILRDEDYEAIAALVRQLAEERQRNAVSDDFNS